MVGQNLIFVRKILSFIPNASEQDTNASETEKNELGNSMSSYTENESSTNPSAVADSQTVHSTSRLQNW